MKRLDRPGFLTDPLVHLVPLFLFVFLATGIFGLGWVTPAFALQTSPGTPTTLKGVKVVSALEAKQLIDGGAVAIDSRLEAQFKQKTIPRANSLPYRDNSGPVVEFDFMADRFNFSRLPTDKTTTLVFFCESENCWSAYKAAHLTFKAGYSRVHWLRGGMAEWVRAGFSTQ